MVDAFEVGHTGRGVFCRVFSLVLDDPPLFVGYLLDSDCSQPTCKTQLGSLAVVGLPCLDARGSYDLLDLDAVGCSEECCV